MATPNFPAANAMKNPYLANVLDRMTNGAEMRRVSVESQALLMSLRATGLAQPATILNFNPVALALDGGIGFKVPSIIDEVVKDDDRFHYKYEGRTYKATVLTITDPKTFLQPKDVKELDGVPSAMYDVKACKQIEIAHCFYVAFTLGMLGNQTGMGGVVIFEGPRRTLEHAEGKKKFEIRMPKYIPLPNKTREYTTEPRDFDECVADALKIQRRYCNLQTQQAQSYWDQEDQRGNVTPIHRIWHQYEMDMGWRQTPAPWVTLSAENAKTCAGCGEPQKRVDAYFCHKCARPYEPFEAYKAGELGIEHPSLNRCDAKQWDEIRKIEAKRKALREGL